LTLFESVKHSYAQPKTLSAFTEKVKKINLPTPHDTNFAD